VAFPVLAVSSAVEEPNVVQTNTRGTGMRRGASAGQPVLLLADPDPLRRARIRSSASGIAVIEAGTLPAAFSLAEESEPDAVALAAELTGATGVEMFAELLGALGARGLVFGDPALYRVPPSLVGRLPFVSFDRSDAPSSLVAYALGQRRPPTGAAAVPVARGPEIILIGASTGGIAAIETVLSAFPADCPPTLVVQHIRAGFIENTIQRLEQTCRPRILCARDGQPLARGHVHVAADPERHLALAGRAVPRCQLVAEPPLHGHRPSVDRLFDSCVPWAPKVAAALLTGMGADGAAGMQALREAGAFTVAQDRATSVVWGMPRVAVEMGAAAAVLPIGRIAEALLSGGAASAIRARTGLSGRA